MKEDNLTSHDFSVPVPEFKLPVNRAFLQAINCLKLGILLAKSVPNDMLQVSLLQGLD